MRSGSRLVLLGLLVGAPSCALAWEKPEFEVAVLDDQVVYTVLQDYYSDPDFRPHIRFPTMDQRANGILRISMNVGQVHGVYAPGKNFKSFDDGRTWVEIEPQPVVQFTRIRPAGQSSYGFTVNEYDDAGFTSWTEPSYHSTDGGDVWTRVADATFGSAGVTYVSMYNNFGEVVEDAGAWLITAFGMRSGQSTYEMVLFASDDQGAQWTRRATIAEYIPGRAVSMGDEGPSEGDIVRLDSGDLLAVYRTGQPFPTCDVHAVHPSIFWSLSSDGGYTWSTPKMLGSTGQQVKLLKLDDGSVAMIYGRYGGKLMFADETGLRWSEPYVLYEGPSCGTVEMLPADDGSYVFAYAQSSFYNTSYDPDSSAVSWTPMDFNQGVEVEFRAREVSGTTLQSAANVMAGDGTGIVSVELTQDGVQLEGLGGNEGQGYYYFDSSQWTTYRLSIAPDAGRGGQPEAKLYVDGVFRLQILLNPTPGLDYLRFGDVTGNNNGGWDLDWLRFRELGTGSWALEYEGDLLPDELPEPWMYDLSGPGSAFIVGGDPDYLHMDTGANGLPVFLYYTLAAGLPAPPACYVYEESGEEVAHLKAARLDVRRLDVPDDLDWALEYHGDVRPDDLEDPWSVVEIDSDTFLWADQGQDYLHLDTGDSGPLAYLHFTLDGASPIWQQVDFTQGLALDIRARAVSETLPEGSANLMAADGANGYTVLEFTDSGISLEGQGGDPGEVTYNIDTTAWHTYRLVIEPEDQIGGDVSASVYIDGDYSTAVLTMPVNPDASHDHLRLGDQVGSDNGAWNVDFLRFALGSTPQTVDEQARFGAGMLRLERSAPNPFSAGTTVHYTLPEAGRVRLTVHEITGAHVATIVDRVEPAGARTAFWDGRGADGRDLAHGIYWVRLEAGNAVCARKTLRVE